MSALRPFGRGSFRANAPSGVRVREPEKMLRESLAAGEADADAGAPSAYAEGAHPFHRSLQEWATLDVRRALLERERDVQPLRERFGVALRAIAQTTLAIGRAAGRLADLRARLAQLPEPHFGEGFGLLTLLVLLGVVAVVDVPLNLVALARLPVDDLSIRLIVVGFGLVVVLAGHVVGSALHTLGLADDRDDEARRRPNRRTLVTLGGIVVTGMVALLLGLNELRIKDVVDATGRREADRVGAALAFVGVQLALMAIAAYLSYAHLRGRERRRIRAGIKTTEGDLEQLRRTKDAAESDVESLRSRVASIDDATQHRCGGIVAWYRVNAATWYTAVVRRRPEQQVDELEQEAETWGRIVALYQPTALAAAPPPADVVGDRERLLAGIRRELEAGAPAGEHDENGSGS